MAVTIDTDNAAQRWRYLCPRCHSRAWVPTNQHIHCRDCASTCSQSDVGAGPKWDCLWDSRDEELVPRSEITFLGYKQR